MSDSEEDEKNARTKQRDLKLQKNIRDRDGLYTLILEACKSSTIPEDKYALLLACSKTLKPDNEIRPEQLDPTIIESRNMVIYCCLNNTTNTYIPQTLPLQLAFLNKNNIISYISDKIEYHDKIYLYKLYPRPLKEGVAINETDNIDKIDNKNKLDLLKACLNVISEEGRVSTQSYRNMVVSHCLGPDVPTLAFTSSILPVNTPPSFFCPITLELMVNPVITSDGYSYERAAIQEWFTKYPRDTKSPRTNEKFKNTILMENITLKHSIEEWKEHCESPLPNSTCVPSKKGGRGRRTIKKRMRVLRKTKRMWGKT